MRTLRYSLRRASPLDFVNSSTHNPKVGGSNPPPATKQAPDYNAFRRRRKAFFFNLLTICSQNSSREFRIYMILPSVWFLGKGQNKSSSCSTTLRSSSPTRCV